MKDAKKPIPKVERRMIEKVISVPPPRPADDLFNPFKEAAAAERDTKSEIQVESPVISSATTYHPPPTIHPPPTTQPIAPARDFSRVANSIARDAVPAGLFRGESKKLYDALYQRTRGAIVPRRSIRATQSELMDWACVSHNTLKGHLKHLSKVKLLVIHYVRGDNQGAEYEVFLPEEEVPPTTHLPPTSQRPATTQNMAPPTSQNLVVGGGGQMAVESMISSESKTSFKTNTERSDDDEAFAGLLRTLKQGAKDVTGKDSSSSDAARWAELAEVLITELKIASARTTVSSAPSFLAEHLRRRLFKKDKAQLDREEREAPAQATTTRVDASKCPDCGGSGFWYPEGHGSGVAKCRHEKLMNAK